MITIYTLPTCKRCDSAKQFIKSKRKRFKEINIHEDTEARNEMIRFTGQMVVPVVVKDDCVIIGFDKAGIERAINT